MDDKNENKYLVVVDMQNDFVTGALGSVDAVAIVPRVCAKLRAHDGPVVFTYDTHGADYLETQEGLNLPVVHCVEGEPGWELVPEIETLRKELGGVVDDGADVCGEIADCVRNDMDVADGASGRVSVFKKGAFGSAGLAEHLRAVNERTPIASIELVGVCTDICVISNAILLKSFLPETKITVDASCCAGVTPESHKTALSAMQACQIEIK